MGDWVPLGPSRPSDMEIPAASLLKFGSFHRAASGKLMIFWVALNGEK